MLEEFRDVRQIEGEPFRRWFGDRFFDLIVWFAEDGRVSGFQLCYAKGAAERALTWNGGQGYTHRRVDDGEAAWDLMKLTPTLVPDGVFDAAAIAEHFRRESVQLEPTVADFVYRKICEFDHAD